MKKRVISILLIIIILVTTALPTYAAFEDFTDIKGHWAESVMRRAYDDGIIRGYSASTIGPNEPITTAQMVTVLMRLLNAEERGDLSATDIPQGTWYTDAAAKAIYLGILPPDAADINTPCKREDAIHMIAEAFQVTEGNPDTSLLDSFMDSKQISTENRRAAATFVNNGYIIGSSGQFNLKSIITRAEFCTILYRIFDSRVTSPNVPAIAGKTVYSGPGTLSDLSIGDIWMDCTVDNINISNVTANTIAIRTHNLNSFNILNSDIGRLILANGQGTIEYAPDESVHINTITVGDGRGDVTLFGNLTNVEVTGDSRRVLITSNVKTLSIFCNNSTVIVDSCAKVDELTVAGSGNTIIADGRVIQMTVYGSDTSITGPGVISTLVTRVIGGVETDEGTRVNNSEDQTDYGLSNSTLSIDAPSVLPAGKTLNATAVVSNPPVGKTCTATWYLDGREFSSSSFTFGNTSIPTLSYTYTYTKDMNLNSTVSVKIEYTTTDGVYQALTAEKNIKLENYSEEYYNQQEYDRVLKLVSTGYGGNYTLEWAENHDYTSRDKELWVNAKGYSSDTPYLIWVSLKYQRCNIFSGYQGHWKLIRSSIVGTGANSTPTPTGVFKTTFKEDGWYHDNYTVRPVVRFYGGGYAFHSRLYYPGSNYFTDPSIGYPVSLGCIRMYSNEIQWMYDYIPNGTTVVVF